MATMRRAHLVLALTVVSLLLGACAAAGRMTPAQSARDRTVAAWRDAVQCMRDHGFAVPDPQFDDQGRPSFPSDVPRTPDEVLQACQDVLNRIPDESGGRGPTSADIAQQRQFASCMRDHGFPTWPDPDPDGRIERLPADIETQGKSPALLTAIGACQRYRPAPTNSGG
jgi:hypothetical protein